MSMKVLIALLVVFSSGLAAAPLKDWWQGFCARNLIADDPYQYMDYSVDELVSLYERVPNDLALKNQIIRKFNLSQDHDDQEILRAALERHRYD